MNIGIKSISAALIAGALVTIIGAGSMLFASWSASGDIKTSLEGLLAEGEERDGLLGQRVAVNDIVIASMDIAVHMRDTRKLEIRQADIAKAASALREGLPLFQRVAQEVGKPELIAEQERLVDVVLTDIQIALPDAIRNAASFEEIVTIADRIIANTVELRKQINTLVASLEASMTELAWRAKGDGADAFLNGLIAFCVALGALIPFTYFTRSRVLGGTAELTAATTALARGDINVTLPVAKLAELAPIAGALSTFRDNALDRIRLEKESAEQRVESERKRKEDMARLAREFEASVMKSVEGVGSAATELSSAATQLGQISETSRVRAAEVTAASGETTGSIEAMAAAGQELNASIDEIASSASKSTATVGKAVDETRDATSQVQSMANSVQRISDVLKLINEIASQTNLLALNATIEAARAGEAGRGFAVVASEVKALANQTAKATEDIAAKITEMETASAQSVEAMDRITGVMDETRAIATGIASAVEEQSAATREIARSVENVSGGARTVTQSIGQVSKAVEETSAAALSVKAISERLTRDASDMRTRVMSFLQGINAA